MKKDKSKKRVTARKLMAVPVVIAILIIFDLSPLGGNIRFYVKWAECGQSPLRAASFTLDNVRYYEDTHPFQPIHFGYETYFCTPLEAEQAGYSASSAEWSFPHLKKS